jgi:predicted Ser/Thr protein kinase
MQPLTPRDPKTIGPYSLIARLGAGGMGSVYLGKQGIDQCAIKVINSSLLGDENARKRFSAEVETLSKLDSEFIAKIVDSDVDADDPWLAMEFVNGPSLKELIAEKGPIGPTEWRSLAESLLAALEELQSKGVIHRDIKPSNILVTTSGPKIIDFGISTALDQTSITATGSVVGSPAWLAPEQLEGTTITSAADTFSLGSVLVFAATGQSPWGDETTLSAPTIFKRILDSEPELHALEHFQQDLVRGLMHPRPSARLTPREASRKLANKTIPAHENSRVSGRADKAPPRRGLFVAIASIAALGLVAAGVLTGNPGGLPIPFGLRGAQVACAETRWVGEDLSRSPASAIESAWERGSLLTAECYELADDAPLALTAEFCQELNSEGATITVRRISGDAELDPVENVWSKSLDNRHGCRSFVDMGKMDWEDSLRTSLSYQVTETVAADTLRAGLFLFASDDDGGTFVTLANLQKTDDAPAPARLQADLYGPVALEVAYDSGGFNTGYDSGEDYVTAEFVTNGTQLANFSCWHEDYLAELEAEDLIFEFQAQTSAGEWVPVPGYWDGDPTDCDGEFKYRPVFTDEHALIPFLSRNECVRVRFVAPGTRGFVGGVNGVAEPVLCVNLEASRIATGEETISDAEMSLLLAMVDRQNAAFAGTSSEAIEEFETQSYPGLYALDSEEWARGRDAFEREWESVRGTTVAVSESGITLDPEWVHPASPCSVPQSSPLPGRTFLLRGIENAQPTSFHYTIVDGEVYRFLDLCRFAD